ncbi:MAG: TVP38/TMEM64 family protein [Burkholderiales bacterium]
MCLGYPHGAWGDAMRPHPNRPLLRMAWHGNLHPANDGLWFNPLNAVRLLIVAAMLCGLSGCSILPAMEWLDASWLRQQQQLLVGWQQAAPAQFTFGYFALFTVLSALSLPGSSVLALAAGLCFGWWMGTALVVLASTCGATLPFLFARYLARDAVQRRHGARLAPVERAIARDGALWLLVLRLAPVIPYFVINPLLGLSSMRVRPFFVASVLGMAPGSAAYVQAGTDLARYSQGGPLFSMGLVAAMLALALLPLAARSWWRRRDDGGPL